MAGPLPLAATRSGSVVAHCVFEIATGNWPAGARLPSVRVAAAAWGVANLTVLDAYGQLVERGLVRCVERSGFFVADDVAKRTGSSDDTLAALFDAVVRKLRREDPTALTLTTFRRLAALAEQRVRAGPECWFVECTEFQAAGHATEFAARCDVPCGAVTTDRLVRDGVPPHVRLLVTTAFHAREVRAAVADAVARVFTVTIELSADCLASFVGRTKRVVFLATGAENASHLARDAARHSDLTMDSEACEPIAVDARVSELLRHRSKPGVILSPSLWSAASPGVRRAALVQPLAVRVRDEDWPRLQRAVGRVD